MEYGTTDGRPSELSSALARLSSRSSEFLQFRELLSQQHILATTTRNTLLQSLQERLVAQDNRNLNRNSMSLLDYGSHGRTSGRTHRLNLFDDVPHITQLLTQLTIDTHSAQRAESGFLQIIDELSVLIQEVSEAANTPASSADLPMATSVTGKDPMASRDSASAHNVPEFVAAFYDKDEDARALAGRLVHLQLDHEDDLVVRRNAQDAGQVIDPPTSEFEAIYQAQYERIRDELGKASAIADGWKTICQEAGWNVDTDVPKRNTSGASMCGIYEHVLNGEHNMKAHQSTMGSESRWSMPETRVEPAANPRTSHALDIESISADRTQSSPPPQLKNRFRLREWANEVEPEPQPDDHTAQQAVEEIWTPQSTSPIVESIGCF